MKGSQADDGQSLHTNTGTAAVLIVEDSVSQATALQRLLQHNGYEVITAGDGTEALTKMQARRPTLVISDILMPGMDGYELCMRIKGDPQLHELPVILLTSLSEATDILKGLECGANGFVIKPYDDDFLLTRIHHALEHVELRKQARGKPVNEIRYSGQTYTMKTDWMQAVELLVSTYETAVEKNQQLLKANEKLEQLTKEMSETLEALAQSHENLKETQDQLIHAGKLQSIGQMAAGIAHDVKNPLQILTMGIAFLTDSPLAGEEEAAVVLKDMKDAVERGNLVISDLLDLSAARTVTTRESSINEIIQRTLRFVRHDFTTSKVRVISKLGEGLRPCMMDCQKIEQVLINIFINACHAMPDGGSLTVTTSEKLALEDDADYAASKFPIPRYRAGDRLVVVEIQDTGTGLSDEVLAKVGYEVLTTKEDGKGNGLGMLVSRQIVELHRGLISIRNAEGGGAMVTITFTQ
ncbi:MAG: response regulator [Chthoniobacteraceae bacterium]